MTTHELVSEAKKYDVLVLPLFAGEVKKGIIAYDKEVEPYISKTIEKDFVGKKKQTMLLYGRPVLRSLGVVGDKYPRLLFVGLGEKKIFNLEIWKQTIGQVIIFAQGKKAKKVGIVVPSDVVGKFGSRVTGQETVIATETAQYSFDEHKSKKDRVQNLVSVDYIAKLKISDNKKFSKGIEDGQKIVEGVNFVRVLGNTPPTIMTPTLLSERAVEMCKTNNNLRAKVLSIPEMKKLGMGCLLGVSSGSAKEPKFIVVEYKGGVKDAKPTVLVGKGITFDSGGLHIKPDQYMTEMKFDMLGAATVLGTIKAAALLGIKKNIVGIIPTCENMPDGDSYRPDDILTAMNGKTVEILNTDAEGRLILADGLSYATMKYKPKEVIDFATLTGACMVALGLERSGLFTEDEKLSYKLLDSSKKVSENLWRLPLGNEYTEDMKSLVADYKNLGSSRYGGASSAAAFLQFFTLDPKTGECNYPWAHIDLSSSYYKGKGRPYIRGGANGFGVQFMIQYLRG
jgi:leucyl aminopeptidase